MIRRIVFQIHWALGITAGLVLVVMSVTGVMMSFEDEIMRAMSPGIVTIAPPSGSERLSPDAIVARVRDQQPGRQVATLELPMDLHDSARVVFEHDSHAGADDRRSYVDPYDGHLLGPATGEHFFATVRKLHRWLLIPGDGNGFGRTITGIASASLIYFALSGLWLRWPRRPFDWRQWFVIDLKRSGRSLYRTVHVVIGRWLVVFYLLSGLTGLWWSYGWYKSGVTWMLTGAPEARPEMDTAQSGSGKITETPATRPALRGNALAVTLSAVLHESSGSYREMIFTIPKGANPIRVHALPSDARYDKAYDDYLVAADSGRILKAEKYEDKTIGQSMTGAWLSLHQGAYFGLVGRIVIVISTASLSLFPVTGWLLYLDRRRRRSVQARQSLETV